jgi:hypothetical protein
MTSNLSLAVFAGLMHRGVKGNNFDTPVFRLGKRAQDTPTAAVDARQLAGTLQDPSVNGRRWSENGDGMTHPQMAERTRDASRPLRSLVEWPDGLHENVMK